MFSQEHPDAGTEIARQTQHWTPLWPTYKSE